MELARLDLKTLISIERPKKIEKDLFTSETFDSKKTIEVIQKDNLEFKENNFEATLETIAISKKPT